MLQELGLVEGQGGLSQRKSSKYGAASLVVAKVTFSDPIEEIAPSYVDTVYEELKEDKISSAIQNKERKEEK